MGQFINNTYVRNGEIDVNKLLIAEDVTERIQKRVASINVDEFVERALMISVHTTTFVFYSWFSRGGVIPPFVNLSIC